jgi:pimeloyl-ACP methyl ester carboxylesterase
LSRNGICSPCQTFMPISLINDVRLFWEQHGDAGAALVLVHGSWVDHHTWDSVVPALARSFRVFTYDRRGHSQSERLRAQGSIEEDVADLAAFIKTSKRAPAHVAGNSSGAAIALKLAAAEPDLLASAIAHEPPLVGMIQDHPMAPAVRQRIAAVVGLLRSGDMEGGARQFVETLALGPGTWQKLPPDVRRAYVFNAPTFLDEMNEPETAMSIDLARLAAFKQPMLLTQGGQGAPFLAVVLDRIAAAVPGARRHIFRDAGHVLHLTVPNEYAGVVVGFLNAIAVAHP